MKRFILSSLLLAVAYSLSAQAIMTNNKKALKQYEKGRNHQQAREFEMAISKYQLAIQLDSSFAEAYRMVAAAYNTLNMSSNAMVYYEQLSQRYPNNHHYSIAHLRLAEKRFAKGHYNMALKFSEKFLTLKEGKDRDSEKAERIKQNSNYALAKIEKPLAFNPRALPSPLNEFKQQYFPVLSADLSTLFFIKRDKDEEIYTANRSEDGSWTSPVPIDSAIVSEFNEGTCTVSADGRTLVFTSCMRNDGYGSCDLYITKKVGNNWRTPKNMGKAINSPAWDSQPSLSADGKSLYFVSNRGGGLGKRDIWVSYFSVNTGWGRPKNLGKTINTKEDDISPFIHVNNNSLYFASDGRLGFGGFDIYYADRNTEQVWSDPKNFGFPINTHNDELAMFITADGSSGYYSHEIIDNEVESKLYQIDIPDEISIKYRSTYISGIITDSLTKEALEASVVLYNLTSNKEKSVVKSDIISGEYLMVLTEGASYALYINAPDYLFKSYHFNLENDYSGWQGLKADIALKPIKLGERTTLNNVLFPHDSYELSGKSEVALKYVADYLVIHDGLHVEIAGFTDNVGTDKYNLTLSISRAASVYNYLVANGVDTVRITYNGYGSKSPVASNTNDSGRAKNRRIELIILE